MPKEITLPNLNVTVPLTLQASGAAITTVNDNYVAMTSAGKPQSGSKPCDTVGQITNYGVSLMSASVVMHFPDNMLPGRYVGTIPSSFASSIINADGYWRHFTSDEFLNSAGKNLTLNYDVTVTNMCNITTPSIELAHGVLTPSTASGNQLEQKVGITCKNDANVSLSVINTLSSQYGGANTEGITVDMGNNMYSMLSIVSADGALHSTWSTPLRAGATLNFKVRSVLHANNVSPGDKIGKAVLLAKVD
ncbi:hypothetical protein BBY57_23015 [Salmonella enterica]|nr:hypothetical protein [Salmonella enterica]